MAEFETVEKKQLIAKRVPPGDRWRLISGEETYESLTDTLEAYFQQTKFNKAFYLDPIGSVLYSVDRVEVEVEQQPVKEYSFYGEFKQGI